MGKVDKIKVLYIGGVNRSGSTLLTKILNDCGSFFGVNELVFIGHFGLKLNQPISTGELFHNNLLWKKIMEDAYGEVPAWETLSFYDQPTPRLKNLLLGDKIPFLNLKQKDPIAYQEYKTRLNKLYRSIQKITGCSVIIDSSKAPEYAHVLSELEDIDFYMLHLVRDPRGTYYSHRKLVVRKDIDVNSNKDQEVMEKQALLKFSIKYALRNICLSRLKSRSKGYVRMRYEDFVASPKKCMEVIFELIHEKASNLVDENNCVSLQMEDYGIWGNPMRQSKGEIKIKHDLEWMKKLSFFNKVKVTIFTLPFLINYRYKIFQ